MDTTASGPVWMHSTTRHLDIGPSLQCRGSGARLPASGFRLWTAGALALAASHSCHGSRWPSPAQGYVWCIAQAGAWDVDDRGLEYMPSVDLARRIQAKVCASRSGLAEVLAHVVLLHSQTAAVCSFSCTKFGSNGRISINFALCSYMQVLRLYARDGAVAAVLTALLCRL
jgi:hypothetical protein